MPGGFRDRRNFIGRPGDTVSAARFVPPPCSELDGVLDSLEKYVNANSLLANDSFGPKGIIHRCPIMLYDNSLPLAFEVLRRSARRTWGSSIPK